MHAKADRDRLAGMVRDDQAKRLREANRRSSEAWQSIQSRGDWDRTTVGRHPIVARRDGELYPLISDQVRDHGCPAFLLRGQGVELAEAT